MNKLATGALSVIAIAALSIALGPWLASSTEAATGGPWVKVLSVVGPVNIGSSSTTVASLSLPAGKYLVLAKVNLVANPSAAGVTCQLQIGGKSDTSSAVPSTAPLVLTAAGKLDAPGVTTVTCNQISAGAMAVNVKITATRVGTLTNVP